MNFRGVLSREAANLLVVLTSQLKQKGITIDLKAIDTMDSLLQMARVFNEPELNDLANRLQQVVSGIETPAPVSAPAKTGTKTMMYRGQKVDYEPAAQAAELPVPAAPKKRTKTIIYRGQKVEMEV